MSLRKGDAVIPMEIYMDRRLSLIQMRVLCALYSFHNTRTGSTVYPKREQLAQRCGYTVQNISRATKKLEELGWVTKVGAGGFSKPVEYRLHAPDLDIKTVSDPDTVSSSDTVSEPDTTTVSEPDTFRVSEPDTFRVSEPDTFRVSEPDTRNKQSIEQSIEQSNARKAKKAQKWEAPQGLHLPAWEEFEQHRREIREPLTNLARTKNANLLTAHPPDIQQQIVDATIANRWKGLFPPNGVTKNANNFRDSREIDHNDTSWAANGIPR